MASFKIGDRVEIPLTKSVGCKLDHSHVLRIAREYNQNFLFIADLDGKECDLHWLEHSQVGERFLLEEIKLWSEESNSWEIVKTIQSINEEIKEKETTERKNS